MAFVIFYTALIAPALLVPIGVWFKMTTKQAALDGSRQQYLITFPADMSADLVLPVINSLAGLGAKGNILKPTASTVVFEVIAESGRIYHRIRVPHTDAGYVMAQLTSSIPGVDFELVENQPNWHFDYGIELAMTAPDRELHIADAASLSSRMLSAVQGTVDGEMVIEQWVVAPAKRRKMPPREKSQQSTEFNVWKALFGGNEASRDEMETRRGKVLEPNFLVAGRIAAVSPKRGRAEVLVGHAYRALRAENGPMTAFMYKPIKDSVLNDVVRLAATPNIMRMQLTSSELMPIIAWPIDRMKFVPGLSRRFTRHFPATEKVPREGIIVGKSTMPGDERPIAISYAGAARHTAIFGVNGSGKSTVMIQMLRQIFATGAGALVIERDGDLMERSMAQAPPHRADDVVVVDFADLVNFFAYNPLDVESAEHLGSRLVEIFESTYETQSVHTRTLVRIGLRALGSTPGTTIADLPVYLLPEPKDLAWAKSLDAAIEDKEVKDFMTSWREDTRPKSSKRNERMKQWDPVQRRLYDLLLPTPTRYMFSQTKTAVQPREMIEGNKLVFINLKGVPEDVASIVGSLVVSQIWSAAKMVKPDTPNFLLLDELQLFPSIDALVIDALATGRKRNFGLILATQNPDKLSQKLQNEISSNALSKISFAAGHRSAGIVADMLGSRDVNREVIQNLEAYTAIGRVMGDRDQSPVVTMKTIPEPQGAGLHQQLIYRSNGRYTKTEAQIKAEIAQRRAIDEGPRPEDPEVGFGKWGK